MMNVWAFWALIFFPWSAYPMVKVRIEKAAGYDKYLSVNVTYENVNGGEMEYFMASWRPGRYIFQNFAAGVIAFVARDAAGNSLKVRKASKDSWKIRCQTSTLTLSYLFNAGVLDAGSTYLGEDLWVLNPINFVGFTQQSLNEKHEIVLQGVEPSWNYAVALPRSGNAFIAQDFHELADSPFIVSPRLQKRHFQTRGVNFYVNIYHQDVVSDEIWNYLLGELPKIVTVQIDVFKECPVKSYDFLYCFVPMEIRHAVEHSKSAMFVLDRASIGSVSAVKSKLLPISAHETWHIWNVKTIRPKEMTPYDYTRAPATDMHWFSEGITDYYTQYTLLKAGLISREAFMTYFENLFASLDNNPASKYQSPAQNSMDSWLTGSAYAPTALRISFYPLGSRVGFLLDLHLRTLTSGKAGLNDFFYRLYHDYYKKGLGVDLGALAQTFAELTGKSFDDFAENFIYGVAPLRYEYVFEHSPIKLDVTHETPDFFNQIGVYKATSYSNGRYLVEATIPGSPAERRGIVAGTVIQYDAKSLKVEIGDRTIEPVFSPDELFKNVRYKFIYSPENTIIASWLGK
jgi:predicted metalloprotease with PDZ domain